MPEGRESTVELRRRAARVVAAARSEELAERWEAWSPAPEIAWLRAPEPGLVMVQGRIGGTGDRFNLGEATVTRATVRLAGGGLGGEAVGSSYVLGSDLDRARYGAILDALLTDGATAPRALAELVEPLERAQREAEARARAEARSTLVDFFTVAREHG